MDLSEVSEYLGEVGEELGEEGNVAGAFHVRTVNHRIH